MAVIEYTYGRNRARSSYREVWETFVAKFLLQESSRRKNQTKKHLFKSEDAKAKDETGAPPPAKKRKAKGKTGAPPPAKKRRIRLVIKKREV